MQKPSLPTAESADFAVISDRFDTGQRSRLDYHALREFRLFGEAIPLALDDSKIDRNLDKDS